MSGEYIVLMRRILRVDRFQLIFRSLLIWSTAPEIIPPTSSNHWGILSVLANFDGPKKYILRLSSRQFFRNQFSIITNHWLNAMVCVWLWNLAEYQYLLKYVEVAVRRVKDL